MAPEGAVDASQTDIYSSAPDGSNVKRLTTSAPDAAGNVQPSGSPALSPDRSRIVYVSVSFQNGQSQSQLRLMNADGTNGRVLNTTSGALAPTWSFDGTRIAFSLGNDGIFVVNADGTNVRRLTDKGANPSWNRLNQIAFNAAPGVRATSLRTGVRRSNGVLPPTTSSYNDIYSIGADGNGLKQLTQQSQTEAGLASINPAWSPGGKTLVFNSVPGSGVDAQLFLINADGSNRRLLGGLSGTDAVWSPDGSRIAYSSEAGLSVVNADGSSSMVLNASDALFAEDTDWR
jgi:Tol biopolymer transport system component